MKPKRKADHIFQRPQSTNYYVRLRDADGRRFIQSLGTSDYQEAAVKAHDMIGEHKKRLLAARPRVETVWLHKLEPGRKHVGEDGGEIIATDKELIHIGHNGAVIKSEPNGGLAHQLVSRNPLTMYSVVQAYLNAEGEAFGPVQRPTVAVKNSDDALLETYLKHNGIDGLREKQARDIWHVFKSVVNKPIKECTRDDGRAIIAHLEAQAVGVIKSATLRRRMVPLVATVNLAIKEGKLTIVNPFSGVIPERDDEEERDAFDDNDMKLIRANLQRLSKSDQVLVRLLATTGLRREEAFEIDREQTENGIRFVTIGSKTPQSVRRVPFPKDLLPHLPKKITGQLIPGRMDTAGKRLREWLTEIGVINPDDDERNIAPMHSFRHRAAQRMRAAGVPEDVREAVGGWANGKKKKTSRKYGNKHGAGYPLSVLKAAIDKIGM
jgi:integrase